MAGRTRRWAAWLRIATGAAGALFLAGVATLATLHLLADGWEVARSISSLASARVALVALVVMLAGLAWLLGVTWAAGRSPRAATLATIAALASLIVIRVLVAIAYDGVLDGEPGIYDRRAAGIAGSGAFPWEGALERPPGYMFILGAAYAVAGRSALTVEALNLLFALGTGLLVLDLARRRYGPRVGVAALMLYALWPAGALMTAVALPHTSYDFAFAAGAWAVVAPRAGWRGSALAGAVLGLSQYLRPTTLFLVPVFILARAWGPGRAQRFLRHTLIPMALAFLLVLLPAMAWHLTQRGTLDISTSAYGGSSVFHGTNLESGGGWSRAARDTLTREAGDDVWARSQAGMRLALERIRERPVDVIALALRKQDRMWGHERYGVQYGIRRDLANRPAQPRSVLPSLASGAFWAGLTALAALGLWQRRRRTDALSALLVGVVLLLALMHGLVEVRDRYHAYAVPLMMPIAGLALVSLLGRIDRLVRRQRRKGGSGATAR